jgi:hypothetical protein
LPVAWKLTTDLKAIDFMFHSHAIPHSIGHETTDANDGFIPTLVLAS